MLKVKKILDDVIFVSKLTNVKNKKIRILFSVVLANLTVLIDILVILIFSNFFSDGLSFDNSIINFFIDKVSLLPLIIILRFGIVLLDRLNLKSLQLKVSESLKSFFIKETFEKSNFTISDASYFLNQLTEHISYFYGATSVVISSLLQMFVYIAFLSSTSLDAIKGFILVGIFLIFPTIYFLKNSRSSMDKTYNFGQKINQNTQKIIENMYLIKLLKTVNFETDKFENNNIQYSKYQFRNYLFNNLNSLIPNFVVSFSIAILIVFFNFLTFLSIEFIGVTLRLVQTLGLLNNGLNMAINSHVHIESLKNIKLNNELIKSDNQIIDVSDMDNVIELEDVSFKFFTEKDLFFNSINLNFKKNSHTVITGSNGSGKSTLLGIVSSILTPESGYVRHNFNQIGYVGTKPLVFEGTLKENLLYGYKENVPDEKLMLLVEELSLFQDFNISKLDMKVSPQSMSSGQLQKVGFIRALLADIDLLLLDESTSNLDESSKKKIFSILSNKNISIINSTHNPYDFDYDEHLNIMINPISGSREIKLIKKR
jgi:ABC-type multidrug transport system fused ATPase/permease subunit